MIGKSITFICIIIIFGRIFGQEVLYPTSASSLGMGNADFGSYTLNVVYYNPAFLASNTSTMLTSNSVIQYFDMENKLMSYSWNRTDVQTSISYISNKIGLSAIYRQQGDRKTLFPIDDPHSYPPFPDSLRSKDLNHTYYLLIFYGKSISSTLSTGFTAKFLYTLPELITKEIMSNKKKFSFSLDFGFQYEILQETFMSILLQNVLSFPWYYSVYDYFDEIEFKQLPLNLQIGLTSNIMQRLTLFTGVGLEPVYFYKDVKYYPRNDSFHFGLRYEINRIIRLLAGYQYRRTIRSFYEKPFTTREVDGSFEIVHEYVYHSLHGFTLGTDIQVKKFNVILSLMTNDRRNYYEDRDINVKGSTFYYSLSIGYIF